MSFRAERGISLWKPRSDQGEIPRRPDQIGTPRNDGLDGSFSILLNLTADFSPRQAQILVNRSFRAAEVPGARENLVRRYCLAVAGSKVHGICNRVCYMFSEQGHGARHVRSFSHQDERLLSYDGRDKPRLIIRVSRLCLQNHILTTNTKVLGELGHGLSSR